MSAPHQTLGLGDGVAGAMFHSTCIPPLSDCRLTISGSERRLLDLEPGHICIGSADAAASILALVLLRYGIEWQIWYRAYGESRRPVVVDVAAARTAALFADMLSREQKQALRSSAPAELTTILGIMRADSLEDALASMGRPELEYLRQFHGEIYASVELSEREKAIVEYVAGPTEYLFTSGGDLRLRLNEESLLNVYGCQPFPRPMAFTFASSTATSVSDYGYLNTELKRQTLIRECADRSTLEPVHALPTELARTFKGQFGLEANDCEVVFCPSGTDAQLICSAIIATVSAEPPVNLVVASDETGSGTPLAVAGKHFSSITGQGVAVAKGEPIAGIKELGLQNLPIRAGDGTIKSTRQIDSEVMRAVDSVIEKGCRPVVHVMDQSKTGCWAPTAECLKSLSAAHGNRVTIVVDACQMRLDAVDLHGYLDRDFIVLVTGSKFYTGPPFSGALLLPGPILAHLNTQHSELPSGLRDYTSRHEWRAVGSFEHQLHEKTNLGANLRWYAALLEMERFAKVPRELQFLGIDTFCKTVEQILLRTPYLEPLFLPGADQYKRTGIGDILSSRRTIYPFFIYSLADGEVLSYEQARRIYELLNSDSSNLQAENDEDKGGVLRRACHIGQPVRVVHQSGKPSAVLRISAGARLISESWGGTDKDDFLDNIKKEIAQIETIVKKIGILIEHPQALVSN